MGSHHYTMQVITVTVCCFACAASDRYTPETGFVHVSVGGQSSLPFAFYY